MLYRIILEEEMKLAKSRRIAEENYFKEGVSSISHYQLTYKAAFTPKKRSIFYSHFLKPDINCFKLL